MACDAPSMCQRTGAMLVRILEAVTCGARVTAKMRNARYAGSFANSPMPFPTGGRHSHGSTGDAPLCAHSQCKLHWQQRCGHRRCPLLHCFQYFPGTCCGLHQQRGRRQCTQRWRVSWFIFVVFHAQKLSATMLCAQLSHDCIQRGFRGWGKYPELACVLLIATAGPIAAVQCMQPPVVATYVSTK